eukprot:325296_1
MSVHQFGTEIKDSDIQSFYHGISQHLVFPEIFGVYNNGITVHCPLSTSRDFAVATIFSNSNKGLIIEFGPAGYGGTDGNCVTPCFSVDWLSDFPNEHECLFIQNEFTLHIDNIVDCVLGFKYETILKALKLIDRFTSGAEGNPGYFLMNTDIGDVDKWMESLISSIICHQLSYKITKYKAFTSLSNYAKEICNVYFQKRTEIYMKLPNHKNDQFIIKLLLHSSCNWVDLNLITTLFPNIEEITMQNIILTASIFENISLYFTQKRVESSLKKIDIFVKQQMVQPFLEKYAKLIRSCNGFLYKRVAAYHICIQMCTPLEFILQMFDFDETTIDFKDTNHEITKLLDSLITMQLSNAHNSDSTDHEQNQRLFNEYCTKKKSIEFNWRILNLNPNNYFCKLICHSTYEWIKIGLVNQLFPNLERLSVSKINLKSLTLENILNHLRRGKTRLQSIDLNIKSGTNVNILDLVTKYKKAFKGVNFNIIDRSKSGETFSDMYGNLSDIDPFHSHNENEWLDVDDIDSNFTDDYANQNEKFELYSNMNILLSRI